MSGGGVIELVGEFLILVYGFFVMKMLVGKGVIER